MDVPGGDTWQAFLAYGALFQPWLESRASVRTEPLCSADVAPLRVLTQRYGTSTSLAWILERSRPSEEVRAYSNLALLYGRTKAERQMQGLERLVHAMNRAGVTPLLLKGSAARVGGIYPDPGFRLMADIDLIVPPEHLASCVAAAEAAGFAIVAKPPGAEAGHALQQYSDEFALLLEVHHQLTRIYERENFPAEMLFEAAHLAEFRGGHVLLPDWSHHAALTILHAVAWDRSRHMALVPIKALLDLAALKASDAPVSWSAVAQLLERAGERSSLIHVETLFRALFGTALTEIDISPARQKRILRFYALGAAYPILHHVGLAVTEVRRRLIRARRQPARLLQLLNPGFYWRMARTTRKALDSKTALH
ncbi:nucleotidyltransferase family protein [Sphingosinicella sp. BN140058]|uniref:nucleotidyltransferase family protein n=1 Tax=Sphingosinicella sp. BN140058 TaxID=1892855 RepID=UPI001FB0CFA7|nr:nucleotidyltransferase family protein [Sphingosinicella sp. BN140058]